jgi:hypothetical protein
MTAEAAKNNKKLLQLYNFNLTALLDDFQGTTLGYGLEFRPVEQLWTILGAHPHFNQLETILTNGMAYQFAEELPDAKRVAELTAIIARGNHKSAESRPEHVSKALAKDVTHGFSMPIPAGTVMKLKGAMAQPLGMAEQLTLTESGERNPKYRLTQDLSYSLTKKGVSINSRIDMDQYPEMVYGWCLLRIIHFIVALRAKHPGVRIFIAKYDYSNAYRRIAHAATAAAQSVALFAGMAFLALRLTFGGSPNPPTWCMFSKMVTDLANELVLCPDWDAELLRNPDQEETPDLPPPRESPTLTAATPFVVSIPLSVTARVDGFIDNLIVIFLDTPDNRKRAPHAITLTMHVTSRPHAGDGVEPIFWQNILTIPKLIA